MPIGFIPLDEFHKRKLQPGESLSLFVYDLKRLLIQAMPDIDIDARDQLLLHQFLTGLPLAVNKSLRVSDDAKSLDKAVERARLLMAIEKDQMQTAAVVEAGEVQELRKQISGQNKLLFWPCRKMRLDEATGRQNDASTAAGWAICSVTAPARVDHKRESAEYVGHVADLGT